jgi:hypothetical protein
MMKKILSLLVIIVSFYGCKKDNSIDNSSGIIGKWSWISTCVGGGTVCMTPASTNTSTMMLFTSNAIYTLFKNDTLIESSTFHIYKSVSQDGKNTSYAVKFDSGDTEIFSIVHDTLSLMNGVDFVSFTSRYKRIN